MIYEGIGSSVCTGRLSNEWTARIGGESSLRPNLSNGLGHIICGPWTIVADLFHPFIGIVLYIHEIRIANLDRKSLETNGHRIQLEMPAMLLSHSRANYFSGSNPD